MRVMPVRLTRQEGTLLSYQGHGPDFSRAITRGHERTATDIIVKMRHTHDRFKPRSRDLQLLTRTGVAAARKRAAR